MKKETKWFIIFLLSGTGFLIPIFITIFNPYELWMIPVIVVSLIFIFISIYKLDKLLYITSKGAKK